MRILHLTTEFPPVIYGGLGTAVGGWVRASARGGLSVGVLLVEGALQVEGTGYPSYGCPPVSTRSEPGRPGRSVVDREGISFFQASWETAVEVGLRLVREWRPDVVHLHTAMLWYVARAIRERTTTPLVYHVHSVDRAEYELGQEPHQWLAHSEAQEAAIDAADRLIAISDSERELLERYYPHARRRVRVAGNGIDDSALARRGLGRAARRTAPVVLYSGRLVERKGIRELLAAVPLVLARAPATRFVLAGGPPPLTGAEVAGQWLSPELAAVRDRLHFTGWLAPDQVAEQYAAADILVVPSRYEPFGMVVLEGMLHALPIVASDVGGPAEILVHERTGLLFPPRDVAALARSIVRLVEEPALRQRIGQAAAAQVRARWAWPRLVRRMEAIYREVART
jgi:glycogen synthase